MITMKKNAGYTITDYTMYRHQENGDNYVVLAHNEKSGMWCTWECTNGTDFYWGHYFNSKTEAIHRSDDYVEEIKAVFFDPWKATEYAMKHFGIASGVRASIYHIDTANNHSRDPQ